MKTHIIYRRKLFFKVIAYVLVALGLEMVFLEVLKSPMLSIIDLIAMILPLVMMPLLMKWFTSRISIELDSNRFRFTVSERNVDREELVMLSGLQSYTIYYPNDRFVAIAFKSQNKGSTEFSFFREKKEVSDADVNEIIEGIRKMIMEYNAREENSQRIALQPSFYASRIGLYCIIGLSVLSIIGILIAAFFKEKSGLVAFFFSLLLILQLTGRRRKELDFYNSIK